MYTQFDDTLPYWLTVAKVACLKLTQPHTNTSLSQLVTDGTQPFSERLAAVLAPVAEKFQTTPLL